jgi:hypothetical protein
VVGSGGIDEEEAKNEQQKKTKSNSNGRSEEATTEQRVPVELGMESFGGGCLEAE